MTTEEITILEKYNDAFRDVVVGKLGRVKDDVDDFQAHMKAVLRLNKEEDFSFLLT